MGTKSSRERSIDSPSKPDRAPHDIACISLSKFYAELFRYHEDTQWNSPRNIEKALQRALSAHLQSLYCQLKVKTCFPLTEHELFQFVFICAIIFPIFFSWSAYFSQLFEKGKLQKNTNIVPRAILIIYFIFAHVSKIIAFC